MPDAAVLATILLILGLFLVAVELMIPSFGLIGMSAFLCLVVSAWSAHKAWWGTDPGFFWTYVTFLMAGIPCSIFGTLYLVQNTALGNFAILRAPAPEEDGSSLEMQTHLHDLIGQSGKTVSPLTPGGMVEVQGERHHAECIGPLLDSGLPVKVVDTRGTRLVVRRDVEPEIPDDSQDTAAAEPQAEQSQVAAKPSGQLDFDIPDNYTAG